MIIAREDIVRRTDDEIALSAARMVSSEYDVWVHEGPQNRRDAPSGVDVCGDAWDLIGAILTPADGGPCEVIHRADMVSVFRVVGSIIAERLEGLGGEDEQ